MNQNNHDIDEFLLERELIFQKEFELYKIELSKTELERELAFQKEFELHKIELERELILDRFLLKREHKLKQYSNRIDYQLRNY
jgi:hypothetical protein